MAKLKNGFDKLTEAQLLVEATSIVTKCTGNSFFADLQTTVTAAGTQAAAYSTALNAAVDGNKNAIAVKDSQKAYLILLLRQLGDFVSATAAGDRVILVSSGFPLVKDREPAPPLTKPNPPLLTPGLNAGEIVAEGENYKGARAIIHAMTMDPVTDNSTWTTKVTTNRTYSFTNLESGKRYWFKQSLVGTKDQCIESDAVSYVSQ